MKSIRLRRVATSIVTKSDGSAAPFLGLEHLEGGSGRLLVDPLPSKEATDALVFETDDVLFGKLRPYLAKSFMSLAGGTCTSEFLVLRPGPSTCPRFLYYLTKSDPFLGWATATSYGSQMPRTSWESMSDFATWLPSLNDQRRIADFLDAESARIDRLVALRERQVVVETERFTSLREVEIELAPGGEEQPLLRLTNPRRPINYGVLMPGAALEVGVPLIEAGDVMRGPIQISTLRRTEETIEMDFSRSRLRQGDLVMAIRGSVGGVQIVPRTPPAILNVTRDAARIAPGRNVVSAFLRHALLTRSTQDWLFLRLTGAAVKGYNIEDIRKVPVRIRPHAEQVRIAKRLDDAERYLLRVRHLMARSKSLLIERRQAVITAAVTGQLDVTTAGGAA